MATKNPFGKTRKIDDPYYKIEMPNSGWEFRVLKLYKTPANSLKDTYARAFCAVKSPYTYGSWEYGDSYVRDVPGLSAKLQRIVDFEARHPGATITPGSVRYSEA